MLPPAQSEQLLRLAAMDRLAAFYHHLDRNDYGQCLACFTADASWMRLGKEHRGADAIRQVLEDRPPALMVRHILTNVFAGPADGDDCTVSAYVSVYTHKFDGAVTPPAPVKPPIGIYAITAEMRRAEDGWRIARLAMAAQFYSPMTPAAG